MVTLKRDDLVLDRGIRIGAVSRRDGHCGSLALRRIAPSPSLDLVQEGAPVDCLEYLLSFIVLTNPFTFERRLDLFHDRA